MTSEKRYCECGRELKRPYNSTIWPKKCPSCVRIEKNKALLAQSVTREKKNKKSAPNKRKKTPRQRAMDRADQWFSRYVRLKYSFESGGELYCKCYTCGKPHPIKGIDNGHWQRRGYKTTRFNEDNARPQDTFCNKYRSGMPEVFELNLIRELGEDRVNELKLSAQEVGEDNEIFYREMADKYRKKFNKLLKERGLKNPWK